MVDNLSEDFRPIITLFRTESNDCNVALCGEKICAVVQKAQTDAGLLKDTEGAAFPVTR
jgi:hypothetical protein